MAADNFAIEMECVGEDEEGEDDVELGLGSTNHLLLLPPPPSPSIKDSVRSSIRTSRRWAGVIWRPVKKLLSRMKLFFIIAIYSFLGAHLFLWLEVPTDLEAKTEAYHKRLIARDSMLINLRLTHEDGGEDRELRWKESIIAFEKELELDEPSVETAWTFWMAFLYAGTIYTTIGYGNIACTTRSGRIATMLYAMGGIPIMIIILNDLGDFLLMLVKRVASTASDMLLFGGVRLGVIRLHACSSRRARFVAITRKMARLGLVSRESLSSVTQLSDHPESDDDEVTPDPPVWSALFATIGWIFLSAWVFCQFEDWTFFESVYFCFISLSTIGLGDITPAHPEYMIVCFGVVMIGLSLVSVCINVVKEKLELMYMALLQKMLADYLVAMESGDPNAATNMMSGFKGNAKFLMPLISKNQGAKVMEKFKEESKAKGIDIPSVLVDIDPNTGMPAFASANKEHFKEYIEKAEEKREEERMMSPSRSPLPSSVPLKEFRSFGTATAVFHAETQQQAAQTRPSSADLDKWSVAVQSDQGYETQDDGCQTDTEKDGKDATTQSVHTAMCESSTQYVTSCCSTGVQPEVSSIYYGDFTTDSESGMSGSDDDSDSDEDETKDDLERNVAKLLEAAESLEHETLLTHADTMDKDGRVVLNVAGNSPSEALLSKQDSIKSTASRKSVRSNRSSQGSKSERSKKEGEEDKTKRRLRKKEKKEHKKRREGLRFMKNSGDQTDIQPERKECAESGTQYEVTTRGRRCQTTVTSADPRKLREIRQLRRQRKEQLALQSQSSPVDSQDSGGVVRKDSGETCTVTVDLALISRAVNECGQEIDSPTTFPPTLTHVLLDDVELGGSSDDDWADEESEWERFSAERDTQTERESRDQQSQLHPSHLGQPHAVTQTNISSFLNRGKRLTKKRSDKPAREHPESTGSEKEETRREIERGVGREGTDEADERTLREAEFESADSEREDSDFRFMSESGVQTTNSSFYAREERIVKEENVEQAGQTKRVDSHEHNFLVDEQTQTTVRLFDSFACQTTYAEGATAVQCAPSMSDAAAATECRTVSSGVQPEVTIFQRQQISHQQESDKAVEQAAANVRFHVSTASQACISAEACDSAVQSCAAVENAVVQWEPLWLTHATTQAEVPASVAGTQSDAVETTHSFCQWELEVTSTLTQHDCEWTDSYVQAAAAIAHTEMQATVDMYHTESQAVVALSHAEIQATTVHQHSSTQRGSEGIVAVRHEESVSVDSSSTQTLSIPPVHTGVQSLAPPSEATASQAVAAIVSRAVSPISFAIPMTVDSAVGEGVAEMNHSDAQTSPITLSPTSPFRPFMEKESGQLWCDFDVVPSGSDRSWTDGECQTEQEDNSEEVSEKEKAVTEDGGVQAVQESVHGGCQTEKGAEREEEASAEKKQLTHVDSQTELESADGEMQTDEKEEAEKECETEEKECADGEVQTENEQVVHEERQTDKELMENVDCQTEKEMLESAEFQTKKEAMNSEECQTDERELADSEIQACAECEEAEVQAVCEVSEEASQTEKRKGKKKKDAACGEHVEWREGEAQAVASSAHSEAQAVAESTDTAALTETDKWLKVYIQELEDERRKHMLDIGIQTGVLARVQHMYGRKAPSEEKDASVADFQKVNLRKTDSSETLFQSGQKRRPSDDKDTLSHASSLRSVSEIEERPMWSLEGPSGSETPKVKTRKSASFKKPKTKTAEEREMERQSMVGDLRSRFEQSRTDRARLSRSSSSE